MTITQLTIRQYLRSRQLLIVAIIMCIPIALAVLARIVERANNPNIGVTDIRDIVARILFLDLLASTLLPLAVMVITTSAFGDEIEDKTLQYLTLKPISRFRIVFEKWLAVVLVLVPVTFVLTMVMWGIESWGRFDDTKDMILPMLASLTVAIAGFGSLFMFISLIVPRALLFGVFYVFIWEATLSRFLAGIRSISISHYTRSIFVRVLDDRRITIDGPSATTTIIITILGVVLISLAFATWRLRSMAID